MSTEKLKTTIKRQKNNHKEKKNKHRRKIDVNGQKLRQRNGTFTFRDRK